MTSLPEFLKVVNIVTFSSLVLCFSLSSKFPVNIKASSGAMAATIDCSMLTCSMLTMGTPNNVWTMFKVNSEDRRTMSLTLFWCISSNFVTPVTPVTDLTHCPGVSNVGFDQVNSGWHDPFLTYGVELEIWKSKLMTGSNI